MSQHHVEIGHDQPQKAPLVALAKVVQQGCRELSSVAQEKDSENGDQNNPNHTLQHLRNRRTCLATPSDDFCLMGRNELLDFELSVVAPAVPIAKLPHDLSSSNLLQQSGQRLAQQPSVLHQLRSKQRAEHRAN